MCCVCTWCIMCMAAFSSNKRWMISNSSLTIYNFAEKVNAWLNHILCPSPGGIKRWFCLTSVCLSVWRLSRTSGRRAACAAGRLDGAYWLIWPGSAGPGSLAWLKAAAARFRCRPGRGISWRPPAYSQWLKWSCEAGGGAHLTKPVWSKPHTHSQHN